MKIFISYRRDDSAGYAGRLFDYLSNQFGSKNVFMDIDTIEPGDDFRKVVKNAVGSCDVVLVMIGKHWLDITDAQGRRRLEDASDWVRVEIATALANPDVRLIPVLVRGASMPGEQDLPEDLKELAWRNAIELSDSRFQHDANKLLAVIERTVDKPGPTVPGIGSAGRSRNSGRSRTWPIILAVIGLGLLLGIALYGIRNLGTPAVNTMTATETTQTLTDPSLGWQDDFNDGIIDGEKWNLPTDPLLIFEQNGVMNFRIVADQSQNAEIWAGLEAKPGQKPIREITFTVMLNSHGELSSGGLGLDVFLKDVDPILSIDFSYDSDEVAGGFSFCPDLNAFSESYERCVNPTPIPDEDAFPDSDVTPLQVRVVSTGESIDFYADGRLLASETAATWIENFEFFVYAEQEGTLQGIIDNLQVIYIDE